MAVHASFGTAFSMTDAYQKAGEFLYSGTLTVGNPDLDPEKSRTLDAGLTFSRPELGVNFDFTYFYTWNDDLIVADKSTKRSRMPIKQKKVEWKLWLLMTSAVCSIVTLL